MLIPILQYLFYIVLTLFKTHIIWEKIFKKILTPGLKKNKPKIKEVFLVGLD